MITFMKRAVALLTVFALPLTAQPSRATVLEKGLIPPSPVRLAPQR